MNKKIIAVTIGDINGIGIEILIKLWKTKKINDFILITNRKLFKKYYRRFPQVQEAVSKSSRLLDRVAPQVLILTLCSS